MVFSSFRIGVSKSGRCVTAHRIAALMKATIAAMIQVKGKLESVLHPEGNDRNSTSAFSKSIMRTIAVLVRCGNFSRGVLEEMTDHGESLGRKTAKYLAIRRSRQRVL